MQIAILHYHLRPGGVTRVMELAWSALTDRGHEALVLTGEPQPPSGKIPERCVRVVSELRYGAAATENLSSAVDAACRDHWGSPADLLHTHNHALGKNFSLPGTVAGWAKDGRALILQLHDFAENARPANYRGLLDAFGGSPALSNILYPHGARVRLVCLTQGAASRLARAGAIVLPNPIVLPTGGENFSQPEFGGGDLFVYPTRGIIRKNLGETLLHAALAGDGENYLITSAPADGKELAAYSRWQQLAGDLGLPVTFDASRKFGRPVYDFLHAATHCLATSMEEGFGMAFLEPWMAGKGLVGRNLPAVTRDFQEAGVDLSSLYERWEIPSAFLDRSRINEMIAARVRALLEAYGLPMTPDSLARAKAAVWSSSGADFGRLDVETQRTLIAQARTLGLKGPPQKPPTLTTIKNNRALIDGAYSLATYGERLMAVYRQVLEEPAGAAEFLDARDVLLAVLNLEDFAAIRCPEA
ncbi:MAG: glycosyltransferase family 4 protein [Terrimicrobiaceae bacterium]